MSTVVAPRFEPPRQPCLESHSSYWPELLLVGQCCHADNTLQIDAARAVLVNIGVQGIIARCGNKQPAAVLETLHGCHEGAGRSELASQAGIQNPRTIVCGVLDTVDHIDQGLHEGPTEVWWKTFKAIN